MGRGIRRVPADWEHPQDEDGTYRPLLTGYTGALRDWEEAREHWERGEVHRWVDDEFKWVPAGNEGPNTDESFEDWYGTKPVQDRYMPEWPEDQRTHLQMYETCSEGTPISPVMRAPEELARWLADNNASAFGAMTATYEQWLVICVDGWAPSAALTDRGLCSGVEMVAKMRAADPGADDKNG